MSLIDSRAIIDPKAKLADDVKVGPWTVIGPDVEIGSGTIIESHVVIKGPTKIGCRNHIYQFATVGEATPDMKYKGEPTRFVMGDDNIIREGVTIHRGTIQDRSETTIGNHNLIMAYAHVGHDSVIGNHVIMVNNSGVAGHCHIGDWAILGGYALVHQYCHIGAYSFLGAASYVSRDVPAFVLVAGNPAQARSMNFEGLHRKGFTDEVMHALKSAYKIVYRKGLTIEQSVEELAESANQYPEVALFRDSILDSKRGITR